MTFTTQPQSAEQPLKGWAAFEQRVAESAEYLLILTFVVIFWMAGFVDLFTHTSEPKEVFGLYSWPFFLGILLYAAGFVVWGWFLFRAQGLDQFKKVIAYIQAKTWLGMALMLVFVLLIASMYIYWERWIRFPLLEIGVLLMIVLFTLVILFASPAAGVKMQLWRKVVIGILSIIIGAEILLQIGALTGISPISNLNGLFTPYGRIYDASEGGPGGGQTNVNGWYYPDFRLKEGSDRYVLVGGSYLMGLQVSPNQNMGMALDRLMNTDKENPREVMSMGTPDYGLQIFMHERLFPYAAGTVNPEEVIVVFHTLNDFQANDTPNGIIPFAVINADGVVDVPANEVLMRHDLWHTVIRGYDPPNPAQTIQSHLFLANLLGSAISQSSGQLAYVPEGYSNIDYVSDTQPFAGLEYLFTPDSTDPRTEAALTLTTLQMASWRAKAAEAGVEMRLVILPYFPADFYTSASTDSWTSTLGEYDLFAPERALQSWAAEQGIPVLPLGQYMQAAGLSPAEIQALFFRDGTRHFNVQGHQFAADSIFGCFYAGAPGTDSAFAEVGCTGQ